MTTKRWTPEIYQSEAEQELQLALATVADLNNFNQTIKMVRMSTLYPNSNKLEERSPRSDQSSLDKFELLLEREFIKRKYFSSVPTFQIKRYVDEFPSEIPEDELTLYNTDEDIQKAKDNHKKRYQEIHKLFDDMNTELKSKNLKEITESEEWNSTQGTQKDTEL